MSYLFCKCSASQDSLFKKSGYRERQKEGKWKWKVESLKRQTICTDYSWYSYERKNFISGTRKIVPYGRTKST
jgi:hypothetical protein